MNYQESKVEQQATVSGLCGPNPSHAVLVEEVARLRDALSSVMHLIESGQLVRDTSHDHEPDYARKIFALAVALGKASKALHTKTT